MRKTWAFLTLVASLSVTAAAFAGDGGGPKGDHDKKADHARLTFSVTTDDDGTCGRRWVTGVVKRTFVVQDNGDRTYTVTRFDRGRFTTTGPVSPGACDATGRHGHAIRAGVKGALVGYLRGTVTGGTFNPKAACTTAECGFTDTFLATFFGANAKFSCFSDSAACKFNFEYVAARGQKLKYRHWTDRGKGAGTKLREEFTGDIADA